MYFLALNTIMSSYLGAATTAPVKYDKMYNSMVKNIEKGTSNEENYKLIEKVLNQRNKELKDLYKQSDYIVKPEYLEWQVFFSGFYDERSRGDNTFESAEYHSDPSYNQQGYYDVSGNFIFTTSGKGGSGKPFKAEQVSKEVELGIRIPIKGTPRDPLNLNIAVPQVPTITVAGGRTVIAPTVTLPVINVPTFTPVTVNVQPVSVIDVTTTPFTVPDTGNNNKEWILSFTNPNTYQTPGLVSYTNAFMAQQSLSNGTFSAVNTGTVNATINATSVGKVAGGATNPHGVINGAWTGMNKPYILKLVGGVTNQLTNMNIEYQGNAGSTLTIPLLFTDAHNDSGPSLWLVDNTTNITLKGESILLYSVQSHSTNGTSSGLRNNGNIIADNTLPNSEDRIIFNTVYDNVVGRHNRYFYLENTGTIELNGTKDLLANITTPGFGAGTGTYVSNSGTININGSEAKGVYLKSLPVGTTSAGTYFDFVNPIALTGDKSIGMVFERNDLNFTLSAINFNIGFSGNNASSTGNSMTNADLVESAIGLYTNQSTFTVTSGDGSTPYQLGLTNILLGKNSSGSMLFRSDGGVITVNGVAKIDKGSNNIGLVASNSLVPSTGKVILSSSGVLNILGGTDAIGTIINNSNNSGAYAQNGGIVENNGLINASGMGTNGIVSGFGTSAGNIINNAVVDKSNNGAAVVLAGGNFTNNATGIIVTRNGSAGVYSDVTAAPVINGGTLISTLLGTPYTAYQAAYGTKTTGIIADNGGIAYYSGVNSSTLSTGNITISGANTTIMNGGLMFYNNYAVGGGAGTYGQFTISPGSSIKVEDGGTIFNFDGTPAGGGLFTYTAADFTSYMTDTFSGSIGNLQINMPTVAGEYGNLFVLNNTIFDLTTASAAISGIPTLTVTGNYRFGLVANGQLNIDNNPTVGTTANPYNLDNPLDPINQVSVVSSIIDIKPGTLVTGTQANQILAKQANPTNTAAGKALIDITNSGTVNMQGANSVSLYARYGQITNNGTMTASNGAISIYGINDTTINNSLTGRINLGTNGIGLASKTQDGMSIAGADLVNMTNTGVIQSLSGAVSPLGMYAFNNNATPVRTEVNATNAGTIDMIASDTGTGAYVANGQFVNTGTIGVGLNGIAVYADNSDINTSGTINLSGNNAIGFNLVNGSSFSNATGTINITGTNAIVFNIQGSSAPFTNSFVINALPGSTYVLANIDTGTFITAPGALTVSPNSVLLSGKDSAIMIDSGTVVTGTGVNGVGIYSDGAFLGFPLAPFTVEAENQGTMNLLDNSAGIYVTNGANALNTGNITVGMTSVGVYGNNTTGIIQNDGTITIGQGSQGMYGKNTTGVINTGTITSTAANATGAFVDGLIPFTNSGRISLLGDDSIGMFSVAAPGSTALLHNTSTGIVKIGNSTNPANPGVALYSENEDEVIINDGEIEVGQRSLGIYKFGYPTLSGTITQNGKITVGDGGTGIYSQGDLITISPSSVMILQGSNETIGIYATSGSVVTNNSSNLSIGSGNYGVVLETGASFVNNAAMTMGTNEVLLYSAKNPAFPGVSGGTIINNAPITMTGSDNVAFYTTNSDTVINNAAIDGRGGASDYGNIGIYNKGGSITNTAQIFTGKSDIQDPKNPAVNRYSVGIYGEASKIINTAQIEVGDGGIGIYVKGNTAATVAENHGHIILTGNGAIGLYAENGVIINEISGIIDVNGNNGIGMAGVTSDIINKGVINLNGNSGTGMLGNIGGSIENAGVINIGFGTDNTGVLMTQGTAVVSHSGIFGEGNVFGTTVLPSDGSKDANGNSRAGTLGKAYSIPSIVNAGVINVYESFDNVKTSISIKVNPATITAPTLAEDAGAKFVSDTVKVNAPYFSVDANNPVQVEGSFTQGTSALVYKLKDVFNPLTPNGGPNSGTIPVVSKSLTWRATPQINSRGNVDIWMEKIPYDDFTDGLWYADFGRALDDKYENAQGDAMKIYDKIDIIENEGDFRHIMAGLAGEVYANINQREEDIAKTFENSLDFIENSTNNTKENVKVNIIAGKGKNSEKTDGVVGYDYSTAGVLGLREVERTYRHTFGYSLGYLHTGFEFNDGNDSEEWVDTIQLGVHSKYSMNDWKLRNDLTGRISFHNVDRNIDWTAPNGRSEMNGMFETYSITSDNILGREFALGKNTSITPYGAFRAMYVTRPTFNETGLEALEVEGNDAWSVKPRAGIELKASLPLGPRTAWQLKGTLDLAYEYELADLNEREKARLIAVEDGYHDLSKPEDEKGTFRTRASLGAEVEDRYGIFLTGEYGIGNSDQDDYRAGVTLKAVF